MNPVNANNNPSRISLQMGGAQNVSVSISHPTKPGASEATTTSMAMSGNGQYSNSSSMIGKPLSRYSGKDARESAGGGDNPRQISPVLIKRVSEKHLKIDVQ